MGGPDGTEARRSLRLVLALAALASVAAPLPLGAQEPAAPRPPRAPASVRWGKWGAAALFAGLTAAGIARHNEADSDYRALVQRCQAGGSCLLGPDGAYLDPVSEDAWRRVLRGDRAARALLIGGQAALAGAVALVIVELSHDGGTSNIPYEPQVYAAPGRDGFLLGLSVYW